MTRVLHIFYLSKVLDFADTVFIVVRRKWRQLSFLHLYHHTSIFLVGVGGGFSDHCEDDWAHALALLTFPLYLALPLFPLSSCRCTGSTPTAVGREGLNRALLSSHNVSLTLCVPLTPQATLATSTLPLLPTAVRESTTLALLLLLLLLLLLILTHICPSRPQPCTGSCICTTF